MRLPSAPPRPARTPTLPLCGPGDRPNALGASVALLGILLVSTATVALRPLWRGQALSLSSAPTGTSAAASSQRAHVMARARPAAQPTAAVLRGAPTPRQPHGTGGLGGGDPTGEMGARAPLPSRQPWPYWMVAAVAAAGAGLAAAVRGRRAEAREEGTALTGPAPSESTTDPAVLQGLLGGPKGLQALSEELQRLGPWDPKNPHAALQQLHQRLLALTATAFPDPARGRAALGALTAAVSSALVAAAAPAFAAAAGDGGAAPEIEAAFRLATFGPQLLWLLMVALPRSPITRAVMEPWFAVAFFAIVHGYVDVVGGQQPGAIDDLAKFGDVFNPEGAPLVAFQQMLKNPTFVTEEWSHVLAWDLFVGRWIWLDGVRRGINTRASVLLTNFTGPPGLLLHLGLCLLSGKGLPPSGLEPGPAPLVMPLPTERPNADALVRRLFGAGGAGSAAAIAVECAEDVVWEDLGAPAPVTGRESVYAMLAGRERADLAAGARVVVDKVADGVDATGFTWWREAQDTEGKGLRGTTYVRLDAAGRIAHVMEAAEPLVKPGGSTAALLKAIAKPRPVDPEAANWARRTPTEGADIVQYLWREVPQGAPGAMEEALSFFADDIVYEDFNFPEPFKGKPAVREFLKEFDIPGLLFIPQDISDGIDSCCFTWEVDLNLGETSRRIKGISFYEFRDGKVVFVRDIPEPAIKPPPVQALAAAIRPGLRRFAPVN